MIITYRHDRFIKNNQLVCFDEIYVDKIYYVDDPVAPCHSCITIYLEQSMPLFVYQLVLARVIYTMTIRDSIYCSQMNLVQLDHVIYLVFIIQV